MNAEIIGTLAGLISCVTFFPQVVKTFRSKSARDISPAMFLLALTGTALWLIYGIMIHSNPIIFTNCIVFILSAIMLILYFKYRM